MLKVSADYPHSGSTCFLTPHGEQARILQRNANGTFLVALQRPKWDRDASNTRTVGAGEIHPTVEAALGLKPARGRGRRRKAA